VVHLVAESWRREGENGRQAFKKEKNLGYSFAKVN